MDRFNRAAAGDKLMCETLRKPPGQPLVFVQQEDGNITADPEVVGKRARETWRKVYRGQRRPGAHTGKAVL